MRFVRGPEGFMEPVFDLPSGYPSGYVAGAEGFCDSTRRWLNDCHIPALQARGLHTISPWDLTDPDEVAAVKALPLGEERRAAHRALNRRIAARNRQAMQHVSCMVASLEGPDVDSGTASEIGYYAGVHPGWAMMRRRPIFAWRTDWRETGEEGATVNLQVEYWIELSGGVIVPSLDELYSVVGSWVQQ